MDLQKSIFQTIAFFDLFDYPLTAEEIQTYLYNYKKPVHIKEIKGVLGEMDSVEKIHDYYVRKGRTRLAGARKTRKFIAEKFWGRVRQYGQYLCQAPFVEMLAVCNNLAYNNPTEQSDIDLFIVIKEGRMWLARVWVTLILQFFGVRRHGEKIAGRFCLSFFITPKRLNMEPLLLPEDPYMAYWTKLLLPIYGEKTYQKFREENQKWLWEKYGIRWPDPKPIPFKRTGRFKKIMEWILGGWLGDFLEWVLKKTIKKRTLRNAQKLDADAGVIVLDDILKFHNHDRRKEYLERWEELCSRKG